MAKQDDLYKRLAEGYANGQPQRPLASPSVIGQVPGVENVQMADMPQLPPIQFGQARPDGTQAYPFSAPQPQSPSPLGALAGLGAIMGPSAPAIMGQSAPPIANMGQSGTAITPSNQLGKFTGRPIRTATGEVVQPRGLTGPTKAPTSLPAGGLARAASMLAKGAIVGSAFTPNRMGDAEVPLMEQIRPDGMTQGEYFSQGLAKADAERAQAQQEPAAAVQPQTPSISGVIEKGGETMYFGEGGTRLEQPSAQAMQDFAKRSAETEYNVVPERTAFNERERENMAAGRARNVSAEQAASAQRSMAEVESNVKREQMIRQARESGIEGTDAQVEAQALKLESQRRSVLGGQEDKRTPEQIKSEQLENERKQQIIEAGRQPEATDAEKFMSELEVADMPAPIKKQAIAARFKLDATNPVVKQWLSEQVGEAPSGEVPPPQAGGEYTPDQEAGIARVMSGNKITREDAIKALISAGKL